MPNWIETGNDYADAILRGRLLDDPVLLALINYLNQKGVLNTVEFTQFVNSYLKADIAIREKTIREPD